MPNLTPTPTTCKKGHSHCPTENEGILLTEHRVARRNSIPMAAHNFCWKMFGRWCSFILQAVAALRHRNLYAKVVLFGQGPWSDATAFCLPMAAPHNRRAKSEVLDAQEKVKHHQIFKRRNLKESKSYSSCHCAREVQRSRNIFWGNTWKQN